MFNIDVDKEVKAYNDQKNKLLNKFVSRLNTFKKNKRTWISVYNRTIIDLERKRDQTLEEVIKIEKVIKEIK